MYLLKDRHKKILKCKKNIIFIFFKILSNKKPIIKKCHTKIGMMH
jgi:hypothetical protein